MYSLTSFSQADAEACGASLRQLGENQSSMEGAANQIVDSLYTNLGDDTSGGTSCALVRLYKTHPYGQLDPELQGFAQGILGHAPESSDMKCLTLLATRGDQADWNDRAKSAGHKAIPLPSENFVSQIPMISRLINQFGLDLKAVLRPDPAIIVGHGTEAVQCLSRPRSSRKPLHTGAGRVRDPSRRAVGAGFWWRSLLR